MRGVYGGLTFVQNVDQTLESQSKDDFGNNILLMDRSGANVGGRVGHTGFLFDNYIGIDFSAKVGTMDWSIYEDADADVDGTLETEHTADGVILDSQLSISWTPFVTFEAMGESRFRLALLFGWMMRYFNPELDTESELEPVPESSINNFLGDKSKTFYHGPLVTAEMDWNKLEMVGTMFLIFGETPGLSDLKFSVGISVSGDLLTFVYVP